MGEPAAAGLAEKPRLKSLLLRTIIGIGLGALFLYLSFRSVSLEALGAALEGARPFWLGATAVLIIITFVLRTWRWQRLFSDQLAPTFSESYRAFMTGALGNTLLPGRLGDLARGLQLGRSNPAIGAVSALSSIVLEKVFDGLVLVALLGLALALAPMPDWLRQAGLLGAVGFGGALLVLVVLDRLRPDDRETGPARQDQKDRQFGQNGPSDPATRTQDATALPGGRLLSAFHKLMAQLGKGLHGLSGPVRFMEILAVTALIWCVEILITASAFQALGLQLPLVAAMITVVFVAAGTMLPAAPGFIGSYQLFIIAALSLYGVERASALALGLTLNATVIVVTLVVGLLALLIKRAPR